VKLQIAKPNENIDAYPYLNPLIERGMQSKHFKKTKFIYDNLYTVNDDVKKQI